METRAIVVGGLGPMIASITLMLATEQSHQLSQDRFRPNSFFHRIVAVVDYLIGPTSWNDE